MFGTELPIVVSIKCVSSLLIGGVRLLSTLLSVMVSFALLSNEVCIVWIVSFLLFTIRVTQFGCVW